MLERLVARPRPVPARKGPALAGTVVVALGLPVFLVAGWPLAGWALAAILWVAGEAIALVLHRLPLGADHLALSGVRAVAMMFRSVAVMVVLIAVAVANEGVGLSAALLYVAAYSLELALSLLLYFGSKPSLGGRS
ncbi:MAG: hypothetical protein C4305_08740 [Thermoleophilia bacterium]